MIVKNQLFVNGFSRCFFDGGFIDLRNAVILAILFFKMMIFFDKCIVKIDGSFASQLGDQLFILTVSNKLKILVGVVLETEIEVVIADLSAGTERHSFSVVGR